MTPGINIVRHVDIPKLLFIHWSLKPYSFQRILNKSNLLPPIKRVWKISFKSQIRLDPRESKPSPGQTSFVTSFLGLEVSKLKTFFQNSEMTMIHTRTRLIKEELKLYIKLQTLDILAIGRYQFHIHMYESHLSDEFQNSWNFIICLILQTGF